MSKNIIRDGQTRRGVIAETPGLNDGIQFTYRPILATTLELVRQQQEKKTAEGKSDDALRIVAKAVEKHLVDWSEVDDKGESVPVNLDNVLRLPAPLIWGIWNIQTGYRPSDAIVESSEEAQDEEEERLERLLEGTLPAVALETERKN